MKLGINALSEGFFKTKIMTSKEDYLKAKRLVADYELSNGIKPDVLRSDFVGKSVKVYHVVRGTKDVQCPL